MAEHTADQHITDTATRLTTQGDLDSASLLQALHIERDVATQHFNTLMARLEPSTLAEILTQAMHEHGGVLDRDASDGLYLADVEWAGVKERLASILSQILVSDEDWKDDTVEDSRCPYVATDPTTTIRWRDDGWRCGHDDDKRHNHELFSADGEHVLYAGSWALPHERVCQEVRDDKRCSLEKFHDTAEHESEDGTTWPTESRLRPPADEEGAPEQEDALPPVGKTALECVLVLQKILRDAGLFENKHLAEASPAMKTVARVDEHDNVTDVGFVLDMEEVDSYVFDHAPLDQRTLDRVLAVLDEPPTDAYSHSSIKGLAIAITRVKSLKEG
jgi:hypothetical protein